MIIWTRPTRGAAARFFMGLLLGVLAVQSSLAQRQHININRPTLMSPSARLGVLGGEYTRMYGNERAMSARPRGAFSRTLERMNFLGAAKDMARIEPVPIPQAFIPSILRLSTERTVPPAWANPRVPRISQSTFADVSLLSLSERLDAPLMGYQVYTPDFTPSPYFAPEPPSSFHSFFGLTEHRSSARKTGEPVSISDLVEKDNQRFVDEAWGRAQALFKRATSDGEVDDRQELLAQAAEQALAATHIDPTRSEPYLVLLLTSLERRRINSALVYLEQAVKRRPTLFAERLDLAQYFGDYKPDPDGKSGHSTRMEALLRRYIQIGDRSGDSQLYALQGFAAWGIKDPVRLRAALQHLQSVALSGKARERVERIRESLRAGLRTMMARSSP